MIKLTDNHSQSFFGQAVGLTIQSSSKSDPFIFLKCIKKKPDSSWEKPSLGEGKSIKCSLDEMVCILHVLKRKGDSWSTYHKYNEVKTSISFSWEDNSKKKLWINIGTYSKMLGFAQAEIFKLLLKHLINEKIENATILNVVKNRNTETHESKREMPTSYEDSNLNAKISNDLSQEETKVDKEKTSIKGSIKAETEKALLIVFNNGQEVWIPKSIIHSKFLSDSSSDQEFIVNSWIVEKNKIAV